LGIKNIKIIYLKGLLFLFTGIISLAMVIIEHPTLKVALLLMLAIWSFARAYYFVFYVIEHYVDDSYKFFGLCSFVRYTYSKKQKSKY